MSAQPSDVEDLLADQRTLTSLGILDLQSKYSLQPVSSRETFGTGEPPEKTLRGAPELPFNGVAILNPTAKRIMVGYSQTGGVGSSLYVPPASCMIWPAKFVQLSLAVSEADAGGPVEAIHVLRLPFPPETAQILPYGQLQAQSASLQAPDVAVAANVLLIRANSQRRGLLITNTGAEAMRLGLGQAAEAARGIFVAAKGGVWNGKVGDVLWRGEVNGIGEGAGTTAGVVEV